MQQKETLKARTDRLKHAIRSYRPSLRELSERSGVPYPSLLDYASGKKSPGMHAFASIIQACGVSPDWVLFGEEAGKRTKINRNLLAVILSILDRQFLKAGRVIKDPEMIIKFATDLTNLFEKNPTDLAEQISALPWADALFEMRANEAVDKALVAAITYEHAVDLNVDEPSEIPIDKDRLTALIDYALHLLDLRDKMSP